MALSVGIVGLPNVGKSTLFNALTEKAVPAENFPFCTIDPSVGVVAVPDERLTKLSEFSHSKKTVPAAVEFVDIAGLVRGASEGEGLGNQFLSHIREVDAIAEVVRIFDDSNIVHVVGGVDPVSDIETVNLELMLSDLQAVTKRLGNIERDAKRGDKGAVFERTLLLRTEAALRAGKLASSVSVSPEDVRVTRQLGLLTAKPIFYVLNKKAGGHNLDEMNDERYRRLIDFLTDIGAEYVVVDAAVEGELKSVHADDAQSFRQEFGVLDDGIDNLIRTGYRALDLISFFTTGEDETRGWTVKRGSTAPEAGAVIHTDFREKFIRASVVHWDTLLESGSYVAARDKGFVRTEGKEYVVEDGDVIEFRI